MAYLTLNGITVPVAAAQAPTLETEEWGQRGRSGGGRLQNGVRASKRTWNLRTKPLPLDEARALRGLIDGQGTHVSFDANLNTDHGLAPSRAFATSAGSGPGSLTGNHAPYGFAQGSTSVVFGAGAEWRLRPTSEWTLVASCYRPVETFTNGWRRYIVRSDGAKWWATSTLFRNDAEDPKVVGFIGESGVLWFRSAVYGGRAWAASAVREVGERTLGVNGGATYSYECITRGTTGATQPTWPTASHGTVTDGTVVWKNIGDGAGAGYCGDLALLPFKVPDSWMANVMAFYLQRPWSALPHLSVGGDIVGLGDLGSFPALSVVGEAGEGEVSRAASGLVESFEFTLSEI